MQCSECPSTDAKYVTFNVGEETTKVCLCEKCIAEMVALGIAVKPVEPPH